jgi:hypothetical protein
MTIERKRTHAPAGSSSIYQDKDDKWHGRVTMGVRDDGTPDRRHVRGKTRAEVTRKVRQLEKERDSGRVRSAGRVWTVEQWLTHWLDNIAAHSVRYKTLVGTAPTSLSTSCLGSGPTESPSSNPSTSRTSTARCAPPASRREPSTTYTEPCGRH